LRTFPANEYGRLPMMDKWAQPNPDAMIDVADPPVPETESLLSELGAFYPVVAYPAAQDTEDLDSEVDQTIYAGLVWP
jgi:hypothetical protein